MAVRASSGVMAALRLPGLGTARSAISDGDSAHVGSGFGGPITPRSRACVSVGPYLYRAYATRLAGNKAGISAPAVRAHPSQDVPSVAWPSVSDPTAAPPAINALVRGPPGPSHVRGFAANSAPVAAKPAGLDRC